MSSYNFLNPLITPYISLQLTGTSYREIEQVLKGFEFSTIVKKIGSKD